jgi:O-antigen/teichoic acid export membrane protein
MRRAQRNVQSSVKWAGVESILNILAALITTLVVGRIIGPEEFGIGSIAFLIGSFAEACVIMPLYEPLIQRRQLHRTLVDAAFTTMMATGAGVFLIIAGTAPLIAMLYDQPRLTNLLIVQGTTCLLAGARGVPEATMLRKLRFSQIALRTIIAKIASVVISVTAALLGMGAWSIILGNVVFSVGAAAMIVLMTKRLPRPTTSLGEVASLLSFGMFSLLDNLLWTAILRIFSFFVSYFQGVQALGELSIAFRINDAGWGLVLSIAGRLAFPMLSRIADDRQRLERSFLQGTRIVCVFVSPVFLGLAITSREIIDVVLGPAWPLASPALVAVCLVSQCTAVRLLAPATVKAVAKPYLLILPDVIGMVFVAVGCVAFRHAQFTTILWVWISFGVGALLLSLRTVQKAIGLNWLTQLGAMGPAIMPSLGMVAVVLGVGLLSLGVVSAITVLLLKVTLGGLVYVSILIALERRMLIDVLKGSGRPADP